MRRTRLERVYTQLNLVRSVGCPPNYLFCYILIAVTARMAIVSASTMASFRTPVVATAESVAQYIIQVAALSAAANKPMCVSRILAGS